MRISSTRAWRNVGNAYDSIRYIGDVSNIADQQAKGTSYGNPSHKVPALAAAMDLYVIYQRADGTVTGNATTRSAKAAPNGVTPIDTFQEVIAGAKINF
jgi:hypothetical protein